MNGIGWVGKLRDFFWNDPLLAACVSAALVALATTPLAFALMGRQQWFKARRGRVMQRPEFASVVAATVLVMGIPAIFLAMVVKSQSFDKNRYEFDPNKTWSVLEQGRGFKSVQEADRAVKDETARLNLERKNLVDNVKKLDEAMLTLRAGMAPGASPAVAKAVPNVLQRLASLRKSVAVDGPQQLMDFTAPPVEVAANNVPLGVAVASGTQALANPTPPAGNAPAPAAAPAPASGTGAGLPKAEAEAEIATVPDPQKSIAGMLPLVDIPAGWEVGKSGEKHLETFNAENLFEKIDGRAESFVDYKVKGMAYTYYHPVGDESNEVQLYIFEMGDTLKALGKYGTEKPDDVKPLSVGTEGYTSAGSTLFYSGPYYTQIVSTKDDARFAGFAVDLAKRIADRQHAVADASAPAAGAPASADRPATPEALFALLPAVSGKSGPAYVESDVFGYAFLTAAFLAEYDEGGVTWKGFVRPYATPEEAAKMLDDYVASAKRDGAEVKEVQAEGADRMVVASNIGLVDAFFVKGNALAGAAGATDAKPAEAFARSFAKSLPPRSPVISTGK